MYDSYISFLIGMMVGASLGIIIAGFMSAIRESEDRREKEYQKFMERRGEPYEDD